MLLRLCRLSVEISYPGEKVFLIKRDWECGEDDIRMFGRRQIGRGDRDRNYSLSRTGFSLIHVGND